MKALATSVIKKALLTRGYELRRRQPPSYPVDCTPEEIEDIEFCAPFAQSLPPERQLTLGRAVEYVCRSGVPGALAECGVWRGGSVMMMLRTLLRLGCPDRDIYLYDTFRGYPEPTSHDVSHWGAVAHPWWESTPGWSAASLDEVRANLDRSDYPHARLHLVEGKVEDTIPDTAPTELALLRIETDWYEPTLHALRHLYPRLSPGGVLVLGDYAHWQGAKLATVEYFAGVRPAPYLFRVDYSCRIAIKPTFQARDILT